MAPYFSPFKLICDISKTNDQISSLAAILQLEEYSLQFLKDYPSFNPSNIDLLDQPLLPDVLNIKIDFIYEAINLIEVFQV